MPRSPKSVGRQRSHNLLELYRQEGTELPRVGETALEVERARVPGLAAYQSVAAMCQLSWIEQLRGPRCLDRQLGTRGLEEAPEGRSQPHHRSALRVHCFGQEKRDGQ